LKNDWIPSPLIDLAVCLSLLTRFPLPHLPPDAFGRSARAVWCYPIAGLLIGGMAAAIAMATAFLGLPPAISAGVLLAGLIVLTGAMHEDGLADTADGFWGGHSVERRLEIMKDSHIGAFGTLAMILSLGLRWICYTALLPAGFAPVICAAVLSRAAMPVVMFALPHARNVGLSHGVGRPEAGPVLIGLAIAITIATLSVGATALACLIGALGAGALVAGLARHKIRGQTGDVLGATQQVAEIAILCVLLTLYGA
jgi:adenosylcobinamide-GDP ribazoletransferase